MADQPRQPVIEQRLVVYASLGLAAVATVSWFTAGVYGVLGQALALTLAWVSIASLKIFAKSLIPSESRLPKTTNLTAIVMLLKLPAVLVIVYLATRLSQPGMYCFLGTLGLVYSAIVWRLATGPS